jgi:hypothetical protein
MTGVEESKKRRQPKKGSRAGQDQADLLIATGNGELNKAETRRRITAEMYPVPDSDAEA